MTILEWVGIITCAMLVVGTIVKIAMSLSEHKASLKTHAAALAAQKKELEAFTVVVDALREEMKNHASAQDPHPGRYVDWGLHNVCVRERNLIQEKTAKELSGISGKLEHITGILEGMREARK